MSINKTRRALALLCLAAASLVPAQAETFPSRPIKLLVGFGAAGSTDALARLYGQKLSEVLNTPVIVDNKPGANQITAIRALQQAPADGYTLYLGTGSSLTQGPGLRKDLPYDPLKDFSLIGLLATSPGVLVVANDVPVHSMRELVAYSIAHPGKLNYGSGGVGTAQHLQMEYLASVTGMKMTHVPYKSGADVMREIVGGTLQVAISPTDLAVPMLTAGKMRALAVTTARRLPYLPGVPGLAEAGVKGIEGIEPYTYFGLVGPAGLPAPIVARLNEAVNKVSSMPDVATRLRETLYSEATTSTPVGFRAFLEKDLAKWREVGKTVKLAE
jgi:tripartite-type tricarboxylate transporter receptor subunit TctC